MTALDTNILIYACDSANTAKQETALRLIADATDGVLLWQVACEFIAASRKLAPQGFTPEQAWARLAEFRELFPLVLPAPGVLDRARLLHVERGCSFWDAVIIAASLDAGVQVLVSEDLPGTVAPPPLAIINPFA